MTKKHQHVDPDSKMFSNGAGDNDETRYDDVVVEGEDTTVSGLKGKGEKKLREELKQAQKDRQEYLAGWQRAKADLINFKREAEEEKKRFARFATEDFIQELLPAMDSFDMAFRDTVAWEKGDPNWRKGVEYIYAQLLSTLEAHGVKQLNPLSEPFDPNIHDSIGSTAVADKNKDGVVVEVVQKGYELGGKIIRAPKVHVGEFTK
ncbi:nucleotide exchange factor GrpE [Candidatus Wolfebacteria bacterium]|nr:nucleotide exchange factor GrpE [Candidatus Wolfebacteria bacterium]